MKRRLTAAFLCLCLLFTLLPVTAFADGEPDSGTLPAQSALCEHHTQHDESCGYTEGTAEISCSHEHTEDCYTLVTECIHEHTAECYPAEDDAENIATQSDAEEAEPTECTHECSEEIGCITKTLDCKHQHDEACGYAPATEGTRCNFVCEVCNVQDSGDVSTPSDTQLEECICETLCTEDSINMDCLVCSVDGADLTVCKGTAPAECTCETLCTGDSINMNCLVCSVDGADLTACKGTAPAECTCETLCTEEEVNANCSVCSAESADLSACKGTAPEECTCETLCTEEEINADCSVCSAEGAELDKVCVGAAPMLPVTVLAAGEHDSHSPGWTELTADTTTLSGGSYYLSGGVEYTGAKSITVSGEVILCLNGHKLDLKGQHISVGSGASLTLCDCSTGGVLTGGSGGNGGGVYVGGGGTFTLTGGNIAGNTANAGGGVYVDKGGTFTMEDGSINNNKATSGGGGGVMVNLGTFTLSGGSITGNATNSKTYGSGGGVCLYGTFYLSGDSIIQDNTKDGTTDNLYLGWQTINITGPLGENAHIGVTAENVPRSFISGWSNNMVGENPANYFSSDGDACGIGLNANGDVVLGSLCTTITLNPNGGTLPEYSLVAGAALPIPTKTGYTFAGWYENPEFSGNPVTDIPTNNTENLNFYAKWTANTYTITANASPAEGGSVTVNGSTSPVSVTAGTEVTLSATANSGYRFVGWVKGNQTVSTDTTYAFNAEQGRTLTAQFERVYTVTVNVSGNGTATTDKNTAAAGETITLTATPDSGYHFDGWRVVSCSVTIQDNKFTMPAGNVDIQAIFDRNSSGGSSDPTYSITLPSWVNGGELKLSRRYAEKGETVTITAIPDEGYELDTLTVTDGKGKEIDLTHQDGSEYTFKMPAGRVEIEVSFREIEVELPFTDVPEGAWYADAAAYVYEHGLMAGTSATTFAPDATTSRSMIATILWRMAGSPVVNYAMDYTDVAQGQWYSEAIRWAASEGIVGGYGNGLFGTNDPITREQFAVMLYRFAQEQGYDVSIGENTNILSYTDAFDISEFAVPALQWACGAGIITGTGDGSTLSPQGQATRAQATVMLMRFCEEYVTW